MNILRHKSWHVRNKDNIERVRRDEENARKEEEERLRKVALAESEARTSLLRDRAKSHRRNEDTVYEENPELVEAPNKHINFFTEEEQGVIKGGTNVDHEREQKEEKEKREKAVGLLKYLGQDSLETQAVKPWYYTGTARKPYETEKQREESDLKKKASLDPMHMMRKYVNAQRKIDGREPEPPPKKFKSFKAPENAALKNVDVKDTSSRPCVTSSSSESSSDSLSSSSDEGSSHRKKRSKHKKKHKHSHKSKKKHKKRKRSHKSEKPETHTRDKKKKSSTRDKTSSAVTAQTKTIAQLRAERLQREQAERQKTQQLFAQLRGEKTKEEKELEKVMNDRTRGYNSQFNPEFVRKPKKKNAYLDMI